MKLYSSGTSPYARKVRAMAIECGIANRIDLVPQSPRDDANGYLSKNPLARIPALELEDGRVLFDSPVICEYLDSLHDGRRMFPAAPERWAALKRQALGDGILDAAVPARLESVRPANEQSADFIRLSRANIARTVGHLDADARAGRLPAGGVMRTLAIAWALGYLDFRIADMAWRENAAALAGWFSDFGSRPAIAETVPG